MSLDDIKARIRENGQHVTPFRIGLQVGLRNLRMPCPYATKRSMTLYHQGIRLGKLQREAGAK